MAKIVKTLKIQMLQVVTKRKENLITSPPNTEEKEKMEGMMEEWKKENKTLKQFKKKKKNLIISPPSTVEKEKMERMMEEWKENKSL